MNTNIKNTVEKFLAGEQGKKFFQIFYSIGAAVIIVGVLAKLMHWPFGLGNIFLYIGFCTETLVFIISAFDHPVKEYQWENVFPDLLEKNDVQFKKSNFSKQIIGEENVNNPKRSPFTNSANVIDMTKEEIKHSFNIPSSVNISEEDSNALTDSIKKMAVAADQLSKMTETIQATQQYIEQLSIISKDMKRFSAVTNNLSDVSDVLLNSYRLITQHSDGISRVSTDYVYQMETLQQNISGLNTIYDKHLKSISSQINTIEKINSGLTRIKDLFEGSVGDSVIFHNETEKMAQQLHDLNNIYNHLLNAMTMNTYGTVGNPNFSQAKHSPSFSNS